MRGVPSWRTSSSPVIMGWHPSTQSRSFATLALVKKKEATPCSRAGSGRKRAPDRGDPPHSFQAVQSARYLSHEVETPVHSAAARRADTRRKSAAQRSAAGATRRSLGAHDV